MGSKVVQFLQDALDLPHQLPPALRRQDLRRVGEEISLWMTPGRGEPHVACALVQVVRGRAGKILLHAGDYAVRNLEQAQHTWITSSVLFGKCSEGAWPGVVGDGIAIELFYPPQQAIPGEGRRLLCVPPALFVVVLFAAMPAQELFPGLASHVEPADGLCSEEQRPVLAQGLSRCKCAAHGAPPAESQDWISAFSFSRAFFSVLPWSL